MELSRCKTCVVKPSTKLSLALPLPCCAFTRKSEETPATSIAMCPLLGTRTPPCWMVVDPQLDGEHLADRDGAVPLALQAHLPACQIQVSRVVGPGEAVGRRNIRRSFPPCAPSARPGGPRRRLLAEAALSLHHNRCLKTSSLEPWALAVAPPVGPVSEATTQATTHSKQSRRRRRPPACPLAGLPARVVGKPTSASTRTWQSSVELEALRGEGRGRGGLDTVSIV